MTTELPLVEPFAVPDIHVSGIADIEDMGDGNYRFVLYTKKRHERIVVASLVLTEGAVMRCILQSAQAIGVSIAAAIETMPKNGDHLN